jgi:hypothetical protein
MFPRNLILLTLFFGMCIVVGVGAGCRREAAPSALAEPELSTPEQSFTEIVEIFRNGMEMPGGDVSGFVTQNTGASSRFQVHNTVTSQFIAPAKPEDPYRGTITVSSQSIYSLRHSAEEDEKKNDEQNSATDQGFGTHDDGNESGSDFQSFDQGLISDPTDDKKSGTDDAPIVQRRPDKVDRTYALVYQGNRWQLATKLDPKTEASVQNAFDRALRLQP